MTISELIINLMEKPEIIELVNILKECPQDFTIKMY